MTLKEMLEWLFSPSYTPPMPTPVTPVPATPLHIPLLERFCQEIKSMEGWYPGSTSWHCKNPGNLRCTPGQQHNWNVLATGASTDNFCIFPDPDVGMQALRNVTTAQCKGLSPVYNAAAKNLGLANSGELNLYQYFLIRDPGSDGNNPKALAERFGKVVGADPAVFRLKQLL